MLVPPLDSNVWVPVPLKVTVPEVCVNVPPVLAHVPDTLNVPEEPGAVNVPNDMDMFVALTKLLEAPVKMPPAIVSPPLKVC